MIHPDLSVSKSRSISIDAAMERRNISNSRRVCIDMRRHAVAITSWDNDHQASTKVFEWKESSNPWDDVNKASEWLSKICKDEKLAGYEVVVSLPRSSVCLHLLSFPRLSDQELAEVVPIQLEHLYNDRHSTLVHDLVKLETGSQESDTVIVATAPSKLVACVQDVCRENGLHLHRLSCMDVVAANNATIQQAPTLNSIQPILFVEDDCIQVALTLGPYVLQYQSIANETVATLGNVVRGRIRLLEASLPDSLKVLPRIQGSCWINSDCDQEGYSELANALGFTLETIDLAREYTFASMSNQLHQIDFLRTWKPAKAKTYWPVLAFVASIITVAMIFAFSVERARSNRLQQALKKIEADLVKTNAEIESETTYSEQWEQVQAWKESRVSWGRALVEIAMQSARSKEAYLHRLQFEVNDSGIPPVIRFDGRARNVTDAIAWNHFDEPMKNRYALVPQSFETTLADPEFPIHFRSEASLITPVTGESR